MSGAAGSFPAGPQTVYPRPDECNSRRGDEQPPLFEVRDKLGLAYNIHSYLDHFQDSGALTVYAGVHPKNLKIGISAILEQLTLLKEKVSAGRINQSERTVKRTALAPHGGQPQCGRLGGRSGNS